MKRRNGPVRAETGDKLEIALLALPEAHASALYGALDIFSTAGVYWDRKGAAISGEPRFRCRIVAASNEPVIGWNGVAITPTNAIDDTSRADLVFIPSVGAPGAPTPPVDPTTRDWLVLQYERGATIASACSGSLVLAETGLLDNEPATTHWAYSDLFRGRFQSTRLVAERAIVQAGEGQRIITAGGGSLWQDLALFLIARMIGREAALHTAKLYVIDWVRDRQSPFASFQERLQHADAVIRKAQAWISAHACEPEVLARARAQCGLHERTFERRFRTATGLKPLRYVQELRIELAKEAMQDASISIDEVAFQVGYADPSSFRRLFKRVTGISPSDYRRRLVPPLANS